MTPACSLTRMALAAVAIVTASAGVIATAPSTGTAATSLAPLPPTVVNAVQDGLAPDVLVTWTPSPVGPAATGAVIQEYQMANAQGLNAKFLGQLICKASCTSVVFRELVFGTFYEFAVFPTNASGTGAPAGSLAVVPMTSCTVGACITLNANSALGPATTAASGIVGAFFPVGNDQADMTALHTTMWRASPSYNTNGSFNWSSWNAAVAAGAPTTLVLSDLWRAFNGGQPSTPWSNWGAYTSWVTSTVTTIVQSGVQVNYWEVYNEPGGVGYYNSTNYATVTTPLLLRQFLVTYNAIKAADPGAAIIGPSPSQWEDYPGQYATSTTPDPVPDMVTFLNFAVANNLQLAAITWHEIVDNLGPNPDENTLLPASLEDHVAEARSLLAARPSLGSPRLFINEYGMGEVQLIPGWDVGYLSALTQARVDAAGRSCWGSACRTPTLDGLLGTNGITPWNDYFDRLVYASMSGSMLPTTSTSDFVTALGSYNATTGTMTGLVGRGVGCNQESWCTQTWPRSTLAPPTAVSITVNVPWSSGTALLVLTNVPGQTVGPTTLPAPVSSTATVSPTGNGQGTVSFSIPSFLDGDAYGFTITQARAGPSHTTRSNHP
ncbi:MAG TPA: hypothetical protein VNG12_18005 [Acidimicrobiales bacterium]|nr:hypothetical protein [Acidimicrobiales bacterium]